MKVLFFLLFYLHIQAQVIVEITKAKQKYDPINKTERIYFLDKKGLKLENVNVSEVIEIKCIGECFMMEKSHCGIFNLATFSVKKAREMGFNAVRYKNYSGYSKNDTLNLFFYRLSPESLEVLEKNEPKKFVKLINPETNSAKNIVIDEEELSLPKGTFIRREVLDNNITLKIGGGPFSGKGQLNFSENKNRTFIILGKELIGSDIGFGLKGATIQE
jgi:hypothetical protein